LNTNTKLDLEEYLNYIFTWENESDEHINSIISELNLLLDISKYHFEPDDAIEQQFNELIVLLFQVERTVIRQKVMQYLANASAITCLFGFGLGMVNLIYAEMEYTLSAWSISEEMEIFLKKLETIDFKIAEDMGETVKNYMVTYKRNNETIAEKGSLRISTTECRVYLLQFMFEIYSKKGQFDVATFRKWAHSARLVYDSKEVKDIQDALNNVSKSKDPEDAIHTLGKFIASNNDQPSTSLVVGLAFLTMSYYHKIETNQLKIVAEEKGIPSEYLSTNGFATRTTVEHLIDNLVVTRKIVSQVLTMCEIKHVVDQIGAWDTALLGGTHFQENYRKYFYNLNHASISFNVATNLP
jgi:hypothetical protein